MSWRLVTGSLCAVIGVAIGLWVAKNDGQQIIAEQSDNDSAHQQLVQQSDTENIHATKIETAIEKNSLPKKLQRPEVNRAPVVFWENSSQQPTVDKFDIPITHMQVDPSYLMQIQVGQVFEFPIPELNKSFIAKLTDTANEYNDVHVWTGVLIDGDPTENVIVTRGKTMTYVTIATKEGVFSASIDNKSGKTQVVNENNIKAAVDEPPAVSNGNLQAPPER